MEVVQTRIVGFLKPTQKELPRRATTEFRIALEFEKIEDRKRSTLEEWHPIIKQTEFLTIREHKWTKHVYEKNYIEKALEVNFLATILKANRVTAQIITYEGGMNTIATYVPMITLLGRKNKNGGRR